MIRECWLLDANVDITCQKIPVSSTEGTVNKRKCLLALSISFCDFTDIYVEVAICCKHHPPMKVELTKKFETNNYYSFIGLILIGKLSS